VHVLAAGEDGTCAASLLSASSCLLLISGVPGQLPPPPPSSPPPLPRDSWEKETASASAVRDYYQYVHVVKYRCDLSLSLWVSLLLGSA